MASNTTLSAPGVATARWSVRLTSVVGWIMLGCGAGILLYLAYALLFTNVGAGRAQGELRDQWQQAVIAPAAPADPADEPAAAPAPPVEGVALVEFVRPGSDTPLIHDEPLVVLDDVTAADLAKGPGHYPDTALPGDDGNFAIAGHRTTYGAPFFHLDTLRDGDEIRVTAPDGARYTYEIVEQQVVLPGDTWVIDQDPLGNGAPTMTVTTCHPRFSAAERLVVHAELVS